MGVASVHGLIAFHSLGPRIGVVTGQGLMGLIRDRYGPRYGGAALALLVLPNLGTTCAELAGGRWVRAVRHPPLPGGANTAVPIRQLSGRGGAGSGDCSAARHAADRRARPDSGTERDLAADAPGVHVSPSA